MHFYVRAEKTYSVHAGPEQSIWELKHIISKVSGIPAAEQCLRFGSKLLCSSGGIGENGICAGSYLTLTGRLQGGAPKMNLTVKPRVQKDKWSLYWKESMETKTDLLPDITIEVNIAATVADMQAEVQNKVGWPAPDKAKRLEGFKDPWDFTIFKGRLMDPTKSLEAQGITADAAVVTVRRVLVPEGWKIINEGEDEDDLSSEDEDW